MREGHRSLSVSLADPSADHSPSEAGESTNQGCAGEPVIGRRQVIVGAAAASGALVLAACSGDDSGDAADGGGSGEAGADAVDPDATVDGAAADGVVLISMFGPGQHEIGSPQRFPFVLGDSDGVILGEVPDELTFQVRLGEEVVEEVIVAAIGEGLPRRYFPVIFTPATAGIHTFVTSVDGQLLDANVELFEAGVLPILRPGDPLPSIDTPTVDDGRGVTPICTRSPACELHETSLSSALGSGPVALLVATPAFCTSAVCGPILDLVVAAAADHPALTYVHAEVYVDTSEGLNPGEPLTEIVDALGLTFEPSLLVAGADGNIIGRLDNTFGTEEIQALLAQAG